MKTTWTWTTTLLLLAMASAAPRATAADGLLVRFRLTEPKATTYYVRVGGYIHKSPWYLPAATVPEGADKEAAKQIPSGQFTPWVDLGKLAGERMHGRMRRSGGLAEFPNVTADFITAEKSDQRAVVIELATAPDEKAVVKRFEESYRGSLTSFLVSPNLRDDAAELETAAGMTARRLGWARAASGGRAVSPRQLIVQTSFWSPQRDELNLQEAEVLRLLGFNIVGNQVPAVREKGYFRVPGHTHNVDFSPGVTRQDTDQQIARAVQGNRERPPAGVPFGFSDEICSRAKVEGEKALEHFHAWLGQKKVRPQDLGVADLRQLVPIHTPEELQERQKQNRAAANRVFYYTSRFRQESTTERLRWLTEAVHRHLGPGPLSSSLVADHPYFSGTGLGMGRGPNPTWGGYPLAADWFDLARRRALDLAGIEDWMGLQYMYGPGTTWEGFQLMGFQAAIFRSGSRGQIPIIAWITPSDETNLRLKSSSTLCQGAKHFFYWTYGPTCTSTENYWSDLRGAYDGIVHMSRQLAAAEHLIAPGRTRPTRAALLYSISSDLWQPFGYVHMLERRGTYLSLVHDQYLVDMLTEEDVEAGRLRDYDVLYATDPCIKPTATAAIEGWVRGGGHVFGTTAAGSRNEFDEEAPGLAAVFGIEPGVKVQVQPGRYHVRGALNSMSYLDEITLLPSPASEKGGGGERRSLPSPVRGRGAGGEGASAQRPPEVAGMLRVPSAPVSYGTGRVAISPLRYGTRSVPATFGVLGAKVTFKPTGAQVVGTFKDGSPAVVLNRLGRGQAVYVGACPALAYIKDAKFVPAELKERWQPGQRDFINSAARRRGVPKLVELSHPVVEAGICDAPAGTALVLANFTYEPIDKLEVRLCVARPPKSVRSVEQGPLRFSVEPAAPGTHPPGFPHRVTFTLKLGLNDVVLTE